MLISKNWRQLGKMTIIDPNGDFLGKTMLEYGFGLCRSKYHHHIRPNTEPNTDYFLLIFAI